MTLDLIHVSNSLREECGMDVALQYLWILAPDEVRWTAIHHSLARLHDVGVFRDDVASALDLYARRIRGDAPLPHEWLSLHTPWRLEESAWEESDAWTARAVVSAVAARDNDAAAALSYSRAVACARASIARRYSSPAAATAAALAEQSAQYDDLTRALEASCSLPSTGSL